MKRTIAILLTLNMVINLAACAQSGQPVNTDPTATDPVQTDPTDPTQPELSIADRLLIYREICSSLDRYTRNDYGTFMFGGGFIKSVPNGNEGLAYCYNYLRSMDDLKPYLTEEGWNSQVQGYSLPDQSPEELLARFTIIEDVLLELKYVEAPSSLSAMEHDAQVIWRYNTNGDLVHIDQRNSSYLGTWRLPEHRFYNNFNFLELYFEYDENGELICPWLGENRTGKFPVIPTYDENGRLISEVSGDEKLLYSHNAQGQLSKVEYIWHSGTNNGQDVFGNYHWDFDYQYDDNGNVTRCVENEFHFDDLVFTRTEDYTYDSYGRVCKIDRTIDWWKLYAPEPYIYQTQQCAILYTYDEQGRILTKSVTSGGGLDANGTPTKECILNTVIYVYGNHYIFDDYKVEFIDKTR